MKLLALSESANHVSCRYRVQAFEPALRRAGWDLSVLPLDETGPGLMAILREATHSDVVLIQRRLLSRPKLSLLRRCARRLIYDFDDALYLRDSNSEKPAESWRRRSRFRATVSACDAVIAGNDHLAARATNASPQTRVIRIPTCVDPNAYPTVPNTPRRGGLRIAWIGSRSTLSSLKEINAPLREASDRLPGLELHVICDRFPQLPGLKVVRHPWSDETEAGDLARCDVGISWLPDHPWSLGKCGLKVLQYMASGLPVIVNSVGVHRGMVSDGVHGLIVRHSDELRDAVLRLAEAPDSRREMGSAARKHLVAGHSVQQWSSAYLEALQSVTEHSAIRDAS